MITFLSSPKPFFGRALVNQVNAIRNWQALDDNVEIILYGEAEGTEEACRRYGVTYMPKIDSTEFGTPFFNSIAEHAAHHARYDIQAYVNCDILLSKDFLRAIKRIKFDRFLMVGQRIDLADGVSIDPNKTGWFEEALSLACKGKVSLHKPAGSDYFVFKRKAWTGLGPVVIGRIGYDNRLIEHCLQNNVPVIDATCECPAFHQYHDIPIISEQERNLSTGRILVGVCDSTWSFRKRKIRRSFAVGNIARYLEIYAALTLQKAWLAKIFRAVKGALSRIGLSANRPSLFSLLRLYAKSNEC